MENQQIEVIGVSQEPRHRRVRNAARAVGATVFSVLAAGAALTISSRSEAKSGIASVERAPTTASRPEIAQQQAMDRQELLELKTAKEKADKAQQVENFYEAVYWNNLKAYSDAVYWNQVDAWVKAHNRIPYDAALWEDLHNCEQGNTWYASGYNSADPGHQLFQGGLGMSTEAWQMAVRDAAGRGVSLPASALGASIDQQMQGAQIFMEDEGWGWSCHVDGH